MKTNILISGLFCLATAVSIAQNTSYSANTVPIGGDSCVAIGIGALAVNTGPDNTAVGYKSLYTNTTGDDNTAYGSYSLRANTIGSRNTAIGYRSLYRNTTGGSNTAIGSLTLIWNTTGTSNIAIGNSSLYNNTTGNYNIAIGNQSLLFNTTGLRNTATGYESLINNTTGSYNTGNGYWSLHDNGTGNYNIANGYYSLSENLVGNYNTAIGSKSLFWNTDGNNNTAIGDSAGFHSLGSGNVYVGKSAGYHETGSNKLYIGNDSNKTVIYADLQKGQILLGNQQPTGYSFKGNRTLNVLGGILTDSIRIALSGNWSDFVFNEDYDLMPLPQLQAFIKTHKHLPDIPNADKISADGIDIGDMQARLLQKIEELTLYTLQQKEEHNKLKEQLATQQSEIDAMKALLLKKQ